MKEKIIEKIRKALALAEKNKNENEAQTAMLMAQKMMAKYHIEMEEIEQEADISVEESEFDIKNGGWRKRLIKKICINYRCDCFIRGKSIIIVGNKDDIEIAKTIYKFAENQLLDGFKKYFKNNYEEYAPANIRNAVRKDYADGFIRGLGEKFERQKAYEIKENKEFAMVITNKKVDDYIENLNIKRKYTERKSDTFMFTDPYAFVNGRDKGLNMHDLHSCFEEEN